jgi:hypothetical protein
MGRLDDYRTAMLVADPDVSTSTLLSVLDAAGPDFDEFVVDHGLGPMWHKRTGSPDFHQSRVTAEALYMAQEQALADATSALGKASIDYAVIKGAATRLTLYDNPALRACHDIDLIVRPDDRVAAASALVAIGFSVVAEATAISRELLLSRSDADIDLHWQLLREGRLRRECVADMLNRCVREQGVRVLNADDALFVLLVHPAFAKHLAGWDMGLHRVADIVACLLEGRFHWQAVHEQLRENGVATAAWASLRWVQFLTEPQPLPGLESMLADLEPGHLRRHWIEFWMRQNLSARLSGSHFLRLAGFSYFLHDTPGDAFRAFSGRIEAYRRHADDLAAFAELTG